MSMNHKETRVWCRECGKSTLFKTQVESKWRLDAIFMECLCPECRGVKVEPEKKRKSLISRILNSKAFEVIAHAITWLILAFAIGLTMMLFIDP